MRLMPKRLIRILPPTPRMRRTHIPQRHTITSMRPTTKVRVTNPLIRIRRLLGRNTATTTIKPATDTTRRLIMLRGARAAAVIVVLAAVLVVAAAGAAASGDQPEEAGAQAEGEGEPVHG